MNASRRFKSSSEESKKILNAFDDDIKKVTEQLLWSKIKPDHRAETGGHLKREATVEFTTAQIRSSLHDVQIGECRAETTTIGTRHAHEMKTNNGSVANISNILCFFYRWPPLFPPP